MSFLVHYISLRRRAKFYYFIDTYFDEQRYWEIFNYNIDKLLALHCFTGLTCTNTSTTVQKHTVFVNPSDTNGDDQ